METPDETEARKRKISETVALDVTTESVPETKEKKKKKKDKKEKGEQEEVSEAIAEEADNSLVRIF